jgi:putative (di)nucleoside polyphosphate hydrolase
MNKKQLEGVYRKNAAVIITNGYGEVLLCEPVDFPGSVQTVQGGIMDGETPGKAARRELEEELGLKPAQYEMVESLLATYKYEWPEDQVDPSTPYIGQEQFFFLVRVHPDIKFILDTHVREFSRVYWGPPDELINKIWEPKRSGVRAAIEAFRRK